MSVQRAKNTISNTFVGIIYIFIHTIYSFIFTNIILSYFGSAQNGLISSINQILMYTSLIEGGFKTACIMSYYVPLANNNLIKINDIFVKSKKYYRLIGIMYFTFLLLLSFLYPLIINISYIKIYITAIIITIGFNRGFAYFAIEKYKTLIIADQKHRIEQLCLILTDIVSITLILIGIKIFNIRSILIIELVITAVNTAQYLYYKIAFNKYYSWIKNNKNIPSESHNTIKQIRASFIHTISSTISYNTDIILLTIFRSLREVSKYSVYNMVISMANGLFNAITKGIESSLGNIYNQDRERFKYIFEKFEYLYILADTIIISTILLVLKNFISLYTKSEKDFFYWDPVVVVLFIVIAFFNNIRNPHGMLIRISEKLEKTKNIFIIEALINLTVSTILVKPFGITGVLLGTLFSVIIRNVFVIKFVYKNILTTKIGKFIKVLCINTVIIIICINIVLINLGPICNTYFQLILFFIVDMIISIIATIIINIVFNTEDFMKLCNLGFNNIIIILKRKNIIKKIR